MSMNTTVVMMMRRSDCRVTLMRREEAYALPALQYAQYLREDAVSLARAMREFRETRKKKAAAKIAAMKSP